MHGQLRWAFRWHATRAAAWQLEKHVAVEDLPTLLDDAITARGGRGTSHAARAFGALDELLRSACRSRRAGAPLRCAPAPRDAPPPRQDLRARRRGGHDDAAASAAC